MAKGGSSKKKAGKARKAKKGKFGDAMKALEDVDVPKKKFGQVNDDGSVSLDPEKLEELKDKVGTERWSNVRFVALNAPFKRRSPTPPA